MTKSDKLYINNFSAVKQPSDSTRYPGMDTTYPSRIPASTVRDQTSYLGTISSITSGRIPGSISDTTTDGRVIHPGGIPSITTGGIASYPAGIPGSVTRGTVSYPSSSPHIITDITYPGGVPGTKTGIAYPAVAAIPGGVPGSIPGGVPRGVPGGVPGGVLRGVPGGVPGGIPGGVPGGIPGGVPGGVSGGVPGGVPDSTRGGDITYPGGIPSTTTSGDTIYPGSVPAITSSGTVYPGSVADTTTGAVINGAIYPASIPGGGITYPGGIPGTPIGGGVTYPTGVIGSGTVYPESIPGGTTTGGSVVYPAGIPSIATGTVYSGNVPSTTTGGDAVYPGSVSDITTAGGVAYHGSVPGTITDGSIAYPAGVSGTATGSGTVYTGSVPGTITGSGIVYPGHVSVTDDGMVYPIGTVTNGAASQPKSVPGGTTTGGSVSYPVGLPRGAVVYPSRVDTVPDTREFVSGQIITNSKAIADAKVYPNGQIPTQVFGERTYPTSTKSDIYHNIGTPGTFPTDNTGVYYSGISPPANQLRGTVHYPERIIPGKETDRVVIPGPSVTVPTGDITYSRSTIPGRSNLDGTRDVFQGSILQGQYPGISRWQEKGTSDLTGQIVGQYPTEGQTIRQYPGIQYPSNIGSISNIGESPQYYQQLGSLLPIENDNSNSQASSSVKQTNSGTQASASAQGKFGQGTAQSQITGSYTGSGSFSAQAGSTDTNKSAQTEINGGKESAVSNAQGIGGYGKSQAQVQLNSELGATTTGAQSSGWNHGTNSQVQASSKGGMADAQANGEGSTSSQAQIGFQPYLETDEKIEKYLKPFHGGGTASAQSGAYTGQSQSQLEGSFQYGITYTGAAQAGSGSGAAASRKPFNFNLTDTELFKPFKPSYGAQVVQKNNSEETNTSSNTGNEYNQSQGLQTSSSSQRKIFTKPTDDNSQNMTSKSDQSIEKSQLDDTAYDYEEEYNSEDYDMSSFQTSINPKISKIYAAEQNNSNYQSQTLHVATGSQYDTHVKQDTNAPQVGDILQPGQSLSGYTIPPGFRGRVISVAGGETITHGDGKSQSQTVSLVPKEPNMTNKNKSPISEIRSLKTSHERLINSQVTSEEKQKNNFPQIQNRTSKEYAKSISNIPMKPSYYTVTNSVTGKLDGRNSPRKYEHRYYTKSSTCGYFTFSCNIVYGSNGRTKICKPKMPTYSDGTPIKC